MTSIIWDQAAFESLCSDLAAAGFSPVPETDQREWVGSLPTYLKSLAPDSSELRVSIVEAWPVRAARFTVPGLVANHVTGNGYICLWADDDPAQASASTLPLLLARLEEWTAAAAAGFPEDDALDAWALYPEQAAPAGEIDLPGMLANASNGTIRHLHSTGADELWTFSETGSELMPLRGALYLRTTVPASPRSLEEFSEALTRAQRQDLSTGIALRSPADRGQPSGGHDFAILAWPVGDLFNALLLSFAGDGQVPISKAHILLPSDSRARRRRAGQRAEELSSRRVLLVGAGSIGGQVGLTLASSGVGHLTISDNGTLHSVNLVRHVLDPSAVGKYKVTGLADRIKGSAPWCEVEQMGAIPAGADQLELVVSHFDIVVDCTGNYATTFALGEACADAGIPLVSTAIYHGGDLYRVRRQTPRDLAIRERTGERGYPKLPSLESDDVGFLELGCTSPVHNAPPVVATRAAADTVLASLDVLMDDWFLENDVVTVIRPLANYPDFGKVGPVTLPLGIS